MFRNVGFFEIFAYLYFKLFEDATSSNFQIINQESDVPLLDTICYAFINYGLVENYFMFREKFWKLRWFKFVSKFSYESRETL